MIFDSRVDRAWAGGLFEGEGCISSFVRRGRTYPVLSLHMKDADVVERFCSIVGRGKIYSHPINGDPGYAWQCQDFEGVQAVVAALWEWLGKRRRAKAVTVFGRMHNSRRELPLITRAERSDTAKRLAAGRRRARGISDLCSMAECGRVHSARGLCRLHYKREWQAGNRAEAVA